MARTSKSRGVAPFTMKSGNTPSHNEVSGASPMPFLKGVGKFFKKAVNTSPIGMGINALTGNKDAETFGGIGQKIMGGGDSGDTSTKIDEIHAALVGSDPNAIGGEGAAVEGSSVDPMTLAAAKEEKALRQA
jgi:hypothetical protein